MATLGHLSSETKIEFDQIENDDLIWAWHRDCRDWKSVTGTKALGFINLQLKRNRATLHRVAGDVYYVDINTSVDAGIN